MELFEKKFNSFLNEETGKIKVEVAMEVTTTIIDTIEIDDQMMQDLGVTPEMSSDEIYSIIQGKASDIAYDNWEDGQLSHSPSSYESNTDVEYKVSNVTKD